MFLWPKSCASKRRDEFRRAMFAHSDEFERANSMNEKVPTRGSPDLHDINQQPFPAVDSRINSSGQINPGCCSQGGEPTAHFPPESVSTGEQPAAMDVAHAPRTSLPVSESSLSERLLSKAEIAAFFGVTPRTVDAWMRQRRICYFKIGRTVRFRFADVIAHMEARYRVN